MKVRGEGEQRIVRVWSSSLRVVDTMNLLYQLISLLHCHNFGERGTGNGVRGMGCGEWGMVRREACGS